jgi:hypothetical protein
MASAVGLGEDYSAAESFGRWPGGRRMQTRAGGCCRWRRSATGWIVAKRPGSAAWIARGCGIGFIGSTFTARKVCSTIGWAGRSRVSWRNWRRSSRRARIARRTGSSCWRRLDLKRVIAEKFGVAFHERYVGKLLKKLGFSPMSARPRHAQNERVVEAFKTYGPPRLQEIIRERR